MCSVLDHRTAVVAQSGWRGCRARRMVSTAVLGLVLCQALCRGAEGRAAVAMLRRHSAATGIQTACRRRSTERRYRRVQAAVVVVQAAGRGAAARAECAAARLEQREQADLHNRVEQLKQQLSEQQAVAADQAAEQGEMYTTADELLRCGSAQLFRFLMTHRKSRVFSEAALQRKVGSLTAEVARLRVEVWPDTPIRDTRFYRLTGVRCLRLGLRRARGSVQITPGLWRRLCGSKGCHRTPPAVPHGWWC